MLKFKRYFTWNVLDASDVELAVFFFFFRLVLASSLRAAMAAALSYSSAEILIISEKCQKINYENISHVSNWNTEKYGLWFHMCGCCRLSNPQVVLQHRPGVRSKSAD